MGAIFFTVDTDGSVLAATLKKYPHARVYDCEVPSGRVRRSTLDVPATDGGDPSFIGTDM